MKATFSSVYRVPLSMCFTLLLLFLPGSGMSSTDPGQKRQDTDLLHWIRNEGQLDPGIAFYRVFPELLVHITTSGKIQYQALNGQERFVLNEIPVNGGKDLTPVGKTACTSRVNFLKGYPGEFITDVRTYSSIMIPSAWPGIDIRLESRRDNIEKYFILHTEANVSDLAMRIEGCEELCIGSDGTLQSDMPSGESVNFTAPIAWQTVNGETHSISVRYRLLADSASYGFELGPYDPEHEIIIDPLLSATYFGGSLWEYIDVIQTGRNGKIYAAGKTVSPDMPNLPVPFYYDIEYNNEVDMFLARFDSSLQKLECFTYLGGQYEDHLHDIVLDTSDNVYLTGASSSPDFPVTPDAYDNSFNNPNDPWSRDIVVAALSPELDELMYSTFLGTPNDEYGWALDLDSGMNPVGSAMAWSDLPQIGPQFFPNTRDLVFFKFNPDLSKLLATNSLTGNGSLYPDPGDLVIDSSDQVLFVTDTEATDLPVTNNCYSAEHQGEKDIYACRLSNDLSTLLAASYIGGIKEDHAYAVITDSLNRFYISGATRSADFPLTPGAFDTYIEPDDTEDALICKLDSNLSQLQASTLLGGSQDEHAYDLELASDSSILVTGFTTSENFPVFCNSYDREFNGGSDVFVSRLGPELDTLIASTYIGGTDYDYAYSIVTMDGDTFYLGGFTNSKDFPTTDHAYGMDFTGGLADGFALSITRNLEDPRPCCAGLLYPEPGSSDLPTFAKIGWSEALGATGYFLSAGTAEGIFDLLDHRDVGLINEYLLPELDCGIRVWVTIEPYNEYGVRTGCETSWFMTHEPFYETEDTAICEGESYAWQGETVTQAGIYTRAFTDSYGCDSIYELNLDNYPTDYSYESVEICDDEYHAWEGQILTATGNYIETFQNVYGCDSILELDLLVHPDYEFTETASICEGESYLWEGLSLNLPGTYTHHLFTSAGCDSTLHLILEVGESYQFQEQASICPGDTLIWQNNEFSVPGVYEASFTALNGCDSTHQLTLGFLPNYEFHEDQTMCRGDSIYWQGLFLSETGWYEIIFTTMDGCDSIYTMDLLVSQPDTTLFVSGDSLFVHDNPNSNYQWITCQDLEPIIGANEHAFLADSSGSYAVIVELYGCRDTSRCHSLIHSGVDKNPAAPGMLIYPNPITHNWLTVVLNSRSDDRGTLELFDLSGKMIWQDQPVKNWLTLDCKSYPEGVYFLKWTTGKQEFTRKVIISR